MITLFVGGGAAIAPPPSLTENTASPPPFSPASQRSNPAKGMNFAAKLMAKYGYKVGPQLLFPDDSVHDFFFFFV